MRPPETDDRYPETRHLRIESHDGTGLHAALFESQQPRAGLLLVHGLQSHAGWFEASGTARELSLAGITSLAFDRRGSGRSEGERGHAASANDFLIDLEAGRAELQRRIGRETPLHVLGNCFATRSVLPHAAMHRRAFRSIILTAPATHMGPRGSYDWMTLLRATLAGRERRFQTPFRDEDLIRTGPWLDWIRHDKLAVRSFTAGFLRSGAALTRRMWRSIRTLDIPLLIVLGSRDRVVDNGAIRRGLNARYRGLLQIVEYDVDHYVDFTEARPDFRRELIEWLCGPLHCPLESVISWRD